MELWRHRVAATGLLSARHESPRDAATANVADTELRVFERFETLGVLLVIVGFHFLRKWLNNRLLASQRR